MPILRLHSVSKHHAIGALALNEVSFDIYPGEMLFVSGHSGAGKSTLLRLIHLHERPSSGTLLFAGRNLATVRGAEVALHRRQVSMVWQDHRLLSEHSVATNVALPLIVRGLPRNEAHKHARALLERMGLVHREKALPAQLSAGEQQRVGIARAVIARPALLLADEPTGNLDPQLALEIMTLFTELSDQGTSVLVASHDLALIKRMRRRVLVLDKGQLIDDISPMDLVQ